MMTYPPHAAAATGTALQVVPGTSPGHTTMTFPLHAAAATGIEPAPPQYVVMTGQVGVVVVVAVVAEAETETGATRVAGARNDLMSRACLNGPLPQHGVKTGLAAVVMTEKGRY